MGAVLAVGGLAAKMLVSDNQTLIVHEPRTELPVCDAVWNTILTLPCSTGLTAAEQDMVIEAVRAHFASS